MNEHHIVSESVWYDTVPPCGRMVEESFRKCDTIRVVPFGIADSIEVDGIHILSADKYELCYFEIVVVPNGQ